MTEWLYLPLFANPPNSFKLFADFIQLTCVSRQLYVFKLETKYGKTYPGGSNAEKQTFIKMRYFILHFNWKYLLKEVSNTPRPQKPIKVSDFISERFVDLV